MGARIVVGRSLFESGGSLRVRCEHPEGVDDAVEDPSRLPGPKLFQLRLCAVELVAIAASNAADAVRIRPNRAVRVLPHGEGGPVRRHDGRSPVLREPEPALRQDRILAGTESGLDVMPGIEAGESSCLFVDVGDKRPGFFKVHAGTGWV